MSTIAVTPAKRPLRVLIIEDYEEDAVLLERHLSRAGYDVQAVRVETREQCLASLGADRPWDLVLADYTLPSFGARDALAMLQERQLDVPFIIVSGTIDEVSAVNAMRAGAHDYVLKGDLDRLLPAIERELADAGLRRERLRTQQELDAAQRRFSATFNQAAVGMAHTAVDGSFQLVNRRLAEMLGQTVDALTSLRIDDFLLPSTRAALQAPLADLRDTGTGFRLEQMLLRADGSTFPAQVTVSALSPLGDDDTVPVGSRLWVVEDISARKAAERETGELMTRLINSERLAAAGRMANTLAHEINNPLEALTNIFYILQTHELSPQSLELVAIAARELERVGHITRSTLSFYRKIPGRTLDLRSLLDEVVQLFASRAAQHHVQITASYGDGLTDVHYDPSLRQVFANLVGNALEAMSSVGGTIQIRGRVQAGQAVVTVSDNGHGIEPEHLRAIFEPFFTTKGDRGTGLGLWVTRGIVEEQGGTLRLRSLVRGPHRGTTMRITLPARSAAAAS